MPRSGGRWRRVAVQAPSKLGRAHAHGPPRVKERKHDGGKSLLISQERADMGLEPAALAGRHHEPECLHCRLARRASSLGATSVHSVP